jgi:hypothetical protein
MSVSKTSAPCRVPSASQATMASMLGLIVGASLVIAIAIFVG